MTSRLRLISLLFLVVSVALAGASVGFGQNNDHVLLLNPTSGCPGTPVALTASLPFQDGFAAPSKVTIGAAAIDGATGVMIRTDPEGLICAGQFAISAENGILSVRGSFMVCDSVCAGPFTVTVSLVEGIRAGSGTIGPVKTLDSVSATFFTGGDGCPRLPVCRPVGGVVMPVNTLAVTGPYLALAGLIVAVSAVVLVKRRRD